MKALFNVANAFYDVQDKDVEVGKSSQINLQALENCLA